MIKINSVEKKYEVKTASLDSIRSKLEKSIPARKRMFDSLKGAYYVNYVEIDEKVVAYAIYKTIDKSRENFDLKNMFFDDLDEYCFEFMQGLNPTTLFIHFIENISEIKGLGSMIVDSLIASKKDILLYSLFDAIPFWEKKGFQEDLEYLFFFKNK